MKQALTFGWGGYAELAVTMGEFVHADHTISLWFMPQYPYGPAGVMLADAGGPHPYSVGQGDYRSGTGSKNHLGPSTLRVRAGNSDVIYLVQGFQDDVGGPIGYRDEWQHIAFVRFGNTLRTYLNGERLQPFTGDEIFPSTGLPADHTRVRVGRRDRDQFYGLIDEVAIYTRALTDAQIAALVTSHLTGTEPYLLAGFTFDNEFTSPPLDRTVTLPALSDIPDFVTAAAASPVPVHYIPVSDNRDGAADRKLYDLRPSKVGATLPFCAGEWWKVAQGHDNPKKSHNGTAAFAWDIIRVNGDTPGSVVLGAAPGRLYYVRDQETDDIDNAISVYHTVEERAVYMHLMKNSVHQDFPSLNGNPADLPVANQPKFVAQDAIANVGNPADGGAHLHFQIATQSGDTFSGAGVGQPVGISNYYRSKDEGKTWKLVPLAVLQPGEMISRYPYSPFGRRGDELEVMPAVASRAVNRLDVFVRGENGHLWIYKWNGHAWSPWEDLGPGRLTSSPAAVSWGPDRLDVFVRGHEGQLAHKLWTTDSGWSGWEDLGGRMTSAPTVASWGPHRLDVFCRGYENQLAYKSWDGNQWSDWSDLGGRLTSAPAAVSWGENRIDVVVRGHDGQLAHKRWSLKAGWGPWNDLGGQLTSAPAIVSRAGKMVDVFVRDQDGRLAQKSWNDVNEWSRWIVVGGRLTSGPGAVSWTEDHIDVFVRGHEYGLARKTWMGLTDSWTEWQNLDQ